VDPFYDILINLKTLNGLYKIFIYPTLYSLYYMNNNEFVSVIAPINNTYEKEEKLICVFKSYT